MTNKTAVQQLMTELRELHPEFFEVHTDKGRQFLNNFHKYIGIEKEQIQDAYYHGIWVDESKVHSPYIAAEDYYTSTFNS